MENNIIRVTKAQKLEALKSAIPADFRYVFPGSTDKDGNPSKAEYVFDHAAVMAFLDYEVGLLAKKNSGEKKLTDNQKANEKLAERVLEYLAGLDTSEDKPGATCAEMVKNIPEFADFTVSKVSAILRLPSMKDQVTSTSVKGKKYFYLA